MNKKIIALIAAIVMIVQTFIPAFAVELSAGEQMTAKEPTEAHDVQTKGTYENLKYSITNGEVTITGHTVNPSGELIIPETIESCPVTAIGAYAFELCTAVTSVKMPSVRTVGINAFRGCSLITSVEMQSAEAVYKEAFYACTALTSANMPSVLSVYDSAFWGCSALALVEMPNIQSLGEGAFARCASISSFVISDNNEYYCADGAVLYNRDKSELVFYLSAGGDVVLPDSVKTIGFEAFFDCDALTSIVMPNVETIGENAFNSCEELETVNMPNVITVGKKAFYFCSSLTGAVMPNVRTIYDDAFYSCSSMTSAVMPKAEVISVEAFDYCRALADVEMPKVKVIGNYAFYYCDSITSLKMPKLLSVEEHAFDYCTDLADLEMPKVQSIGTSAFAHCSSLVSVDLHNVVSIADRAFVFCDNLEAAYFYCDAPSTFGAAVFDECDSSFTVYYAKGTSGWSAPAWNGYPTAEFDAPVVPAPVFKYKITDGEVTITGYEGSKPEGEIEIPETIEDCPVTTIGDKAFSECYSLTGVDMPSVTKINYRAFYSCSSLAEVNMPNVQIIGSEAFYRCEALESAYIPNIQTIDGQAFYVCSSLESVTMPDVQTVGVNAFRSCGALKSFVISAGNENYSADGGILYNKDKSVLICYPGAKGGITLADSVHTVATCAFDSCFDLTGVDMPEVLTIEEYAFVYCLGLTDLNMPKVQIINQYSFQNCTALESVEAASVQSVGGNAFGNCYALTSVDMPAAQELFVSAFATCVALENVNMPAVQIIHDRVFYGCKALQSIDLPRAREIGSYAFNGCTALKSVDMPSVQTLIYSAFYQCTSLTSVNLVNVQSIGYYVFWGCSKLESAYFYSDAPADFGSFVFDSCAEDFTIYYAKGMQGWTTPEWNGYNAQEFDPYGYCYVTFVDGVTSETIRNVAVKSGLSAFAPEAPEHEGYTFTGWDKDFSNVTEDMTVTALYEAIHTETYTVTFKDGLTDETIGTATVEHGADVTFPTVPEHEGYTFTGWDSDGTNITSDTTITAQYALNTYIVLFIDGLTDETIFSETVEHGKDATFPTAPEHEGYTFTGWDKDGKNITADTTITALYEEIVVPTPTPTQEPTPTPTGEPTPTPTTEPTPTQEPEIPTGDLSGDGKINTSDAVFVLKAAAGMIQLEDSQSAAGDCNHDGKVNTADAVLILKYAAGMITEFPM